MKLSTRVLRLIPVFSVAGSLTIALMQTLAYLTSFDISSSNYFASGSVLYAIAGISALLLALLSILIARITPRGVLAQEQLPYRFATIPSAIGSLAAAIILFRFTDRVICIVSIVFLILSAIHQIASAFYPTGKDTSLLALLGFSNVFGPLVLIGCYYFDSTLEMNASLKVTVLIGLLCVMLFSTGELRYQLSGSLPRVYMMLALWLASIGALTAIPVPVAALAGVLTGKSGKIERLEYIAGALVVLGTFITAALRLWGMLRSVKAPEPPVQDSADPNQPQNSETTEKADQIGEETP